MDHFKLSHKILKYLLSISVLSLLFLSLPLLLQSLKPFMAQFFCFTINKTYMFLLCNGLMVFIAKNSGLIDTSPSTSRSELSHETPVIYSSEVKELDAAAPVSEENGKEAEYPVEDEEEEAEYPEEEEKSVIDGVADEEEEDEGEVRDSLMVIDGEEHDAEELNKKCDDFIRKMKAAFCSEPRAYYSNYNYNYYYSDVDHQKPLVAVR